MRIHHIATRFALLLAVAAIVPLLAYGVVSLVSLRRGTRSSVVTGNANVATRAADEIGRYVTTNARLLKALAADLQETGLASWQQERILRNYVLRFPEFREITLLDEHGVALASTRVESAKLGVPGRPALTVDGVAMSPIRVDNDLLPTAVLSLALARSTGSSGWLTGEVSLEELWRMVDRIRIGEHGYAMVVAPGGDLVAHGDPDKKGEIALSRNMANHPLMRAVAAQQGAAPVSSEYVDGGSLKLGVATRVAPLGWTVIVEQPTSEADANATRLQHELEAFIAVALLAMVAAGYVSGRHFLTPIRALQRGTQAVAAGQLDTRVDIRTGDEFSELGDAFNTMADRLVALQENVKRQERQAMFGRLAAGLVHDLSHPIQNLGNNARLLVRDDLDSESRQSIRVTIERELEILKRFMEDLRHVVKPRPVERFPVEINASLTDIIEAMRIEGDRVGVLVAAQYAPDPLVIEADRFALGRVYRNLISNAIQATPPGGRVVVTTSRQGDEVEIGVADTGSGIASDRLAAIFEDFVTTKRHGLGLGLAITKRIVDQLGGTIAVESQLGHGTSFTLRFPAQDDRDAQAAAS